jgi:predicted NAD-dependent protein-ADP-ribosyltransferase YbiA (DUF1768 family)
VRYSATWIPAEQLLNTVAALMVNGNINHDNYWGICRCLSTPSEERKYGTSAACNCSGLNRLGHLLVIVRDDLKVRQEEGVQETAA